MTQVAKAPTHVAPAPTLAPFQSLDHKQRFFTLMQDLGKIWEGNLDEEYASAFFLLTADLGTWRRARSYVSHSGINFQAMLKKEDWSGGERVLTKLAGNLFNGNQRLGPVELMRLDDSNFQLALHAICIRHSGLRVDAFADVAEVTQ